MRKQKFRFARVSNVPPLDGPRFTDARLFYLRFSHCAANALGNGDVPKKNQGERESASMGASFVSADRHLAGRSGPMERGATATPGPVVTGIVKNRRPGGHSTQRGGGHSGIPIRAESIETRTRAIDPYRFRQGVPRNVFTRLDETPSQQPFRFPTERPRTRDVIENYLSVSLANSFVACCPSKQKSRVPHYVSRASDFLPVRRGTTKRQVEKNARHKMRLTCWMHITH